jgi:hypothetical protein
MVSIFIMFSPDREVQLDYTIRCLERMNGYQECQKVLVCDGKPRTIPKDFSTIIVPRINGKFSWSNMWEAGVTTAKHEIVWYLDSDRLLPPDYLSLVKDLAADDVFIFSSRHYFVLKNISLQVLQDLLPREDFLLDERSVGLFRYEPRYIDPPPGPGKNVMSGNTAFTKSTFFRLKGVDPWYCGHGAFADTDFHMTAKIGGCTFVDTKVNEFHYHHDKQEKGKALTEQEIHKLSLHNFIYYCLKWNLSMGYAEYYALQSGLTRKFVKDTARELSRTISACRPASPPKGSQPAVPPSVFRASDGK